LTATKARLAGLLPAPVWIVYSAGTGAVSGAMAIAFYFCVDLATRWLLGSAGYHPATFAAQPGGFHVASGFSWPWLIPLLTGAVAFAAAVLVYRTAPETVGHGTDVAIRAINNAPTGMRLRAMPVKMIASAATIGAGGSAGSEGPTAQMAATTASAIARLLRLDYRDARTLVTAGLAAGVGAIFRAPLGGAMLGVELLFRRDRELAMLVPSLIASIVAYAEFGAVYGYAPMFGHVPGMGLTLSAQLVLFPVLGAACGLLARGYAKAFYWTEGLFGRLRIWRPLRVGAGGVLAGALGLAVPGVLGTGYGTIQYVFSGDRVMSLSLLVLIAMPFAKIVGTSLTVGSGGSGGVFGPGMVAGATMGALLWRLAVLAGIGVAPASPALLAAVGMAACLGAAIRAPVAITLIAAETTRSLWVLPAALLAVPIAVAFMGGESLYHAQPRDRAELAALREGDGGSAAPPERVPSPVPEPVPAPLDETADEPQLIGEPRPARAPLPVPRPVPGIRSPAPAREISGLARPDWLRRGFS